MIHERAMPTKTRREKSTSISSLVQLSLDRIVCTRKLMFLNHIEFNELLAPLKPLHNMICSLQFCITTILSKTMDALIGDFI